MRELFQSGTTYLPAAWLADTSVQRTFTGAQDPSTTAGVVLAMNDLWESTGTSGFVDNGNGTWTASVTDSGGGLWTGSPTDNGNGTWTG